MADDLCQGLAHNLPGTYRAWLSTSAFSPATKHVPGAHRYVNTGPDLASRTVADSFADLVDGELKNWILYDEAGDESPGRVWTGTLENGQAGTDHCKDWSVYDQVIGVAVVGDSTRTDHDWTNLQTSSCADEHPIYCVEQGE